MNSALVSVVVPVFNAEEYLPRVFACFDTQMLRDFEVIFVDDGSSDASLDLLKDYASRRENVVIIQQENRGAGASRNVGLERAKGDYVVFVDADDAFTPTFLDSVCAKAVKENADIVLYGHVTEFGGEAITSYPQVCGMPEFKDKSVFSWRDDPERILTMSGAPITWNRLYRRSFLLGKGLRFPNVPVGNDWPFAVLATIQAERIAWLREAPYIYIRRLGGNSLSAHRKKKHQRAVLEGCEFVLQGSRQLPHYELIRSSVWNRIGLQFWKTIAFNDWRDGDNAQMRKFLAGVSDICQRFGMTGEDVEAIRRLHPHVALMLKVLDERSTEEIERALHLPFVLALHARTLEDVLPVIESEKARQANMEFQFSAVDVYLPSSEFTGGNTLGEGLDELIHSGWLRFRKLDEGSESKWFFVALKDNPHAHVVCGTVDNLARTRSPLDCLVVSMLDSPASVLAGATRTVRLDDGSAIEPEFWLETETMGEKASANLWIDTCGYYLIPYGVLDVDKAFAVAARLPEVACSNEEYVLNAALQACGIPVASARHPLPENRKIGGSAKITNIDSSVLEWIEVNCAFNIESSMCGGRYTREEYLELLVEQYERQYERNRQFLDEKYTRVRALEPDISCYLDAYYKLKALTHGVALLSVS